MNPLNQLPIKIITIDEDDVEHIGDTDSDNTDQYDDTDADYDSDDNDNTDSILRSHQVSAELAAYKEFIDKIMDAEAYLKENFAMESLSCLNVLKQMAVVLVEKLRAYRFPSHDVQLFAALYQINSRAMLRVVMLVKDIKRKAGLEPTAAPLELVVAEPDIPDASSPENALIEANETEDEVISISSSTDEDILALDTDEEIF